MNYNAIFRTAYISTGRHLSPMKIVKTIYHFLRITIPVLKSILQSESGCGTLASHKGGVSTKETPGNSLPCLLCHVSTVKKKGPWAWSTDSGLVGALISMPPGLWQSSVAAHVDCSGSLLWSLHMSCFCLESLPSLGHCSPPQLQVSSISKKPPAPRSL